MQSIRLSAKEILDKDFKSSVKGYNKDEVDQYLDVIIQDYEAFEERVGDLENEIERMKKQGPAASAGDTRMARDSAPSVPSAPAAGGTNYDILKRLSNLEKEVFGKKLYE
ncbi:cell division regulator GpsB [Alteribacillus sp. HJP-4]|uniref:cell division regulator GpsB n=1 Tax=Alteribacillus sp. HJP-4 TaxID=2775394 RepID=UPI0035CD07BA